MKKYKEINLKAKSKLIISKELQSQIMFLHNKVKDIEWSGILFHSVVSGNINEPETLVLKAEKVYLQDIGVSTYTEFETNEKILDFYDAYPQAMSWKMSLIHTHHSMQAFFSGTDTQELHDNAGKYNYYLSLIVNHKSEFCAKIAIAAEYNIEKANYTFKGFEGIETIETSGTKSDVLMLIDCDIEFEQDEFDVQKYNEIKESKKVVKPTYDFSNSFGEGFGRYGYPKTTYSSNPAYNYNYNSQTNLFEEPKITTTYELSDFEVRKFLVKWLTLDVTNDTILSDVLSLVNKYKNTKITNFIEEIDMNLEYFIEEVFPNLPAGKETDKLLLAAVDVLSKYSSFKVTNSIIDLLSMYISDYYKTTKKSKTSKV